MTKHELSGDEITSKHILIYIKKRNKGFFLTVKSL
jgi:hypothetical protein